MAEKLPDSSQSEPTSTVSALVEKIALLKRRRIHLANCVFIQAIQKLGSIEKLNGLFILEIPSKTADISAHLRALRKWDKISLAP